MTLIPRAGERVMASAPAASGVGRGTIHVTTRAVAFEVERRGLYLHFVPREAIRRLEVQRSGALGSRRCVLAWAEGGAEHSFEFRTKKHAQIRAALERGRRRP